jgi:hypothetical protein
MNPAIADLNTCRVPVTKQRRWWNETIDRKNNACPASRVNCVCEQSWEVCMAIPAFSMDPPTRIYIRDKRIKKILAITLALAAAFLIAWQIWTINLFSSDFLPHRFCYLTNSLLITLHFVCD